jgi:replicative DNA helicase
MTENMLVHALSYAKRGWFVFPCREKPGAEYTNKSGEREIPQEKAPYISKGLDSASVDADQIKSWWRTYPNAMIGINCGKSGLFVVDLDMKTVDGKTNFYNLGIETGGALFSNTPSGGIHLVFSGDGKSSNKGKLGIDTRGEGGYFIAPPSEIFIGKYTGKYAAIGDWSLTPAPIPAGLLTALFPPVKNDGFSVQHSGDDKAELSRATLYYIARGAIPGERDTCLYNALTDYAGCGYSLEEADTEFWPISEKIGFTRGRFTDKLENVYSKPRTPSIPEFIQEKIKNKKLSLNGITPEQQSIIEDSLLSCMIKDNTIIPRVLDIVVVEDFTTLVSKKIFSEIEKLYSEGKSVDVITLSSQGVSLNEASAILDKYNISPENALSYANILKEISAVSQFNSLMIKGAKLVGDGISLSDAIAAVEKEVADISIYSGIRTTSTLTAKQATDSAVQLARDIQSGKIKQLMTGFADFDNVTDGLYPWDLLLLTGKPGEGKSALALSVVKNVGIDQNQPVVFFTLEMSVRETVARLICQITGLPFKKVLKLKLNETEMVKYTTAKAIIDSSKIFFDDSSSLTIPELRAKVRRLKEKHGIVLVVIDQLEQLQGYANLQEHIRFDKLGYALKMMGKDFELPIILCHQLKTRSTAQDKKSQNADPKMSDLNQAGEKPATLIWAIVHKKAEDKKIVASKIVVLKNRNDSCQDFMVAFIAERMLFSNAARADQNSANFLTEPLREDDLPDCGMDD